MLKRLMTIGVLTLGSSLAHASPATDELSKCLVASSTAEDRISLVRWMFAAAAAHPAVAPISKVTPKDLDAANQTMADLFTRLLTQSCKEETKKAALADGVQVAIQQSFTVLGQTAGAELFTNPEVVKVMAGLMTKMDPRAFESFLK